VSAPLSVWPTLEAEVNTGSVAALAGLPGIPQGASLLLTAAFYRAGAPTATPAERRTALQGWVGTGFDLAGQLRTALARHHQGLIVDVYDRSADGSRQLVAASSSGSRDLTYTRAVDASSRWDVVVRGDEPNGATTVLRALAVFLIGALLSLLAFLLFRRIGRARDHAVTLLNERDGELLHRALHDPVTGLANRALALESAEGRLARARRRAKPLAALLIDLDGFKRVNATYTPRVGDELLRAVADRITATVPETCLVARLGGDEFIVLTEPSASGAAPELIAERLLSVIHTPFDFPGYMRESLTITASIGIAFCETGSVQDLQRDTAAALEEAKAAGKDRVVTFDSSVREAAEDRLELEQELQIALREEQFVLVYQPAVDLRTGAVRGVETELRWDHPTRGRLGPEAFLTLAEDAGRAAELDRWVIDEACRQGAAWEREGIPLVIAVNVSSRQLERRHLVDDLESALTVSGLTPSRLAVDVPEQALVSAPVATGALLEAIKALGVHIAVDEFGTGTQPPVSCDVSRLTSSRSTHRSPLPPAHHRRRAP
jgi:diguanylate cyclase (GGDEF)-like protein